MFARVKKIITYLWGKRSELQSMDERDMLLAKVVMDIHRKRTHSAFVFVPLFALNQIHPINRENSLKQTQKRVDILQKEKERLLKEQNISKDELARYLPSVSAIKAVRENEKSYIAYEGNGRLVALQTVFSPQDGVNVEIEEYYFTHSEKIIKQMNRVRQLHGLIAKNDK